MRVHTIIHAPFEKAGVIEDWALRQGQDVSSTHTYKGEKLPEISTIDLLVIMGGPQSPLELDQHPYLRDEIILAKQAIDQHKPIVGVCLGAQIISESLGAKTQRSPHKEIGVYPVQLTKEGENDPIFKTFPQKFNVMHWHNDMPGIPSCGVVLAYSEGCPHQAVRYGDRVYGLQFHMEMTAELVKGMVEHCASDLKPGKYVQDAQQLLKNDLTEINQKMIAILDHLSTLVGKKSAVAAS